MKTIMIKVQKQIDWAIKEKKENPTNKSYVDWLDGFKVAMQLTRTLLEEYENNKEI